MSNKALVPFRDALAKAEPFFAKALPQSMQRYMTPDRIGRIALSCVSRNRKLMECTPVSVARACMEAATLGLEPGSPLGHFYLVPFKGQATGMIGYRGFIELARRSGDLKDIHSHCVYSKDLFEVSLGSNPSIRHEPQLRTNRGELIAVYCVAHMANGGIHHDVMTADDVESHRKRSRTKTGGPWVTDYDEMARKTVVRRAAKYWPMSMEISQALAHDDGALPIIGEDSDAFTEPAERKSGAEKMVDRLSDEMPEPEVIPPSANDS